MLNKRFSSLWDPTPAETIDPEDAFIDDDTAARVRNIDTGAEIETKPSRLRDIDVGEAYTGRVISRKELKPDWSDDGNAISDDDDIDEDSQPLRTLDMGSDDDVERTQLEFESPPPSPTHSDGGIAQLGDDNEFDFDATHGESDDESGISEVNAGDSDKELSGDDFNDSKAADVGSAFQLQMNQNMDEAEKLLIGEKRSQKHSETSDKSMQPQQKQIRKALAVSNQCKFYDKVASLRIHMHKAYQIAQKLPRPSVHRQLLTSEESTMPPQTRNKLKRSLSDIETEALNLADTMLGLQAKMLCNNSDIPLAIRNRKRRRLNPECNSDSDSDIDESGDKSAHFRRAAEDSSDDDEILTSDYKAAPKKSKKSKPTPTQRQSTTTRLDELWNEMNDDWKDLLPFCNKNIDIWDRKMRLVDSYAVNRGKKKGKQNLSILERLSMVLDNPQPILQKMQSVDKYFQMYGDNTSSAADAQASINRSAMNDQSLTIAEKDARIMSGLEDPSALKYDRYRMECEVFNDSQFYRRMLKEIIDIGSSTLAADGRGGESGFGKRELHEKMDTISEEKKRQKLEYHRTRVKMKFTIRPDMENFMAPRYTHDTEFAVHQLYNCLFQQ